MASLGCGSNGFIGVLINNKTPRQAAKTKKGRELLEALLLQYERMDDQKDKNDPFRADIDFIKTTLKLEK